MKKNYLFLVFLLLVGRLFASSTESISLVEDQTAKFYSDPDVISVTFSLWTYPYEGGGGPMFSVKFYSGTPVSEVRREAAQIFCLRVEDVSIHYSGIEMLNGTLGDFISIGGGMNTIVVWDHNPTIDPW